MINKIIHQIWIGGEPPQFIIEAMESVKEQHPDYEYVLWENKHLERFGLEHLLGETKESFITNIMRVKILNEFGGWYIDADTISKGSMEDLPSEMHNKDLVVALLDEGGDYKYQSAFIGATVGFNFSDFLDEYVPMRPCIPIWDKFLKQIKNSTDMLEIGTELFGTRSEIFLDLRIGSWAKE